ncbi:MAG: hypothetical protein ACKOXT_00560 [Actinomycetota bacterium]
MRFLLATVLFIIAISLLLLGLAQRTIWAPPEEYSISLSLTADKPYLVIMPEQLALLPGDVTVTASGADSVFIAEGNSADVAAWIGESEHYEVIKNKSGSSLVIHEVVGTEDFDSPIGSDLWQNEVVAQRFASLTVPEGSNRAIILASDGFDPTPSNIGLSWPIVTSTVISDIFLGVGSSVLLAAIVLNLLALRRMIINRGPRRKLPKAPRGPQYRPKKGKPALPPRGRRSARRNMIAVLAGVGLTFSLSACQISAAPTAEPTPSPSESATSEVIPPVATLSQVKRILRDVAATVELADSDTDLQLLATRVSGPALKFREAQYLLMSKSPEVPPPAPISSSAISISLPASSNVWPRSIMVVTEGESDLPQMLVLQQNSPREKYKLWYNIPLLPGSEIPAVPAPEIGAIPVEPNSLFLKLPPEQLADAFGEVIDNGASSEKYSLFDLSGDEFYEQISSSQQEQIAKLKRASIRFSHDLGDPNVIALSTSDSGALVAVLMTDSYLIKPTKANSAVTVTGDEELLLGVEGSIKGVRTTYGDMLLFYVPASTSEDRIKLLGATQVLLAIRAL